MSTSVFLNAAYNGAVLSDGLAATASNTGASAILTISGSTVTWKADTQFNGAWSTEFTNVAGQFAVARLPLPTATRTPGLAVNFTCPALPTDTNAVTVITLRRAGGVLIQVQVQQSGQWNVLVGPNAPSMTAPKTGANATPAALVPGTVYRFEVYVDNYSATGTTANVHCRMYAQGAPIVNSDGTPSYLAQTENGYSSANPSASAMTIYSTAGEPFTHVDVGVQNYATVRTFRASNARLNDAATTWAGPYSATTPDFDYNFVASPQSGTSPLTVNFSVTRIAGTGTGNTMSVPLDYGDGTSATTVTVTGTNPATFTHTYSVNQATDFTASTNPVLTA